ncbi:MAG: adenylate/guanylate cyclase with Chase sensor [Vampirovibrio sp.]|jgi:adenylate cyclase|nr:adenylate/guanylate cyclase with Chase sensor [Vampirovibrio sp.]
MFFSFFTLLIGLLFIYASQNIFYAWELDNLSTRQKMFSSSPQDRSQITPIVLVAFDQKTIGSAAYNQLFGSGLSRRAAAYAVRFFKRTHPKAVIFDISFNGGIHYNDLSGDAALADSLQNTNSFASLMSFDINQKPGMSYHEQPRAAQEAINNNSLQVKGLGHFPIFSRQYRYASLLPPYANLLDTPMRFYAANSFSYKAILNLKTEDDANAEARRWIPFSLYGNRVIPSIPLGALLNDEKQATLSPDGLLSWKTGKIHLGSEGLPLIKWYGHGVYPNKPVYPEVSFSDVVLSEVILECREKPTGALCNKAPLPSEPLIQPHYFKDKFNLIGFTIPNKSDTHKTIYSPQYYGLYIVANMLDNALHDDFVFQAPGWLNILAFLLLPSLVLLMIWRFKSVWISLLMTLTLSLGYFLLCIYAYNQLNIWIYAVHPALAAFISFGGFYVYRYRKEYKKRQQMRYAFGKYVSPAVLQIIEQHPEKVKLGGERREMTFLFSDIRGFTAFSDQNPPEVVQAFLTQYFSTMNKIILHSYQGSINKLIGDAIMAYWGFPLQNEDHAFQAVSAALAMRDAMMAWQEDKEKIPITIGIGINTGEAVIGNIGSEDFMDFTVIGDAVNVASRLEGINKEYGTNIIISAATYEKVKDRIHARRLGWAELKGKGAKVEVFEPLSFIKTEP